MSKQEIVVRAVRLCAMQASAECVGKIHTRREAIRAAVTARIVRSDNYEMRLQEAARAGSRFISCFRPASTARGWASAVVKIWPYFS